MITSSQKKPPPGLFTAKDRVEDTALQTILEQSSAAEAFCQERCTRPAAYTIAEFCRLHGQLSEATFFNLRKRGDGPVVMKVGRRTMISAESAAAWRQRMEALASTVLNRGGRQP
jgi:hypothetical protein